MTFEINASEEYSLDAIAFQDASGNWRAGPDNSRDKAPGQFIGADYATRARNSRKYWNDVKRAYRSDAADSVEEAREVVTEYKEMKAALDRGDITPEEFDRWVGETFSY